MAILRGALLVQVDRRFVSLVLDATGPPNEEETPSLGAALNCLHIVLRTHPHLRHLHAAAAAVAAGDGGGAAAAPGGEAPPEGDVKLSAAGKAEAAAAAEVPVTAATAAAETGGILLPYEEPPWVETLAERQQRWQQQELLLQHFVIPPLEKPLELPWGLAEAPLLPAWRLQRGSKGQQLQLLSFLNTQTQDILVAPLHAIDLLFCKLVAWREGPLGALSSDGGAAASAATTTGATAAAAAEQTEEMRRQCMRRNIHFILRAYLSAAKMLKWEDMAKGPLADAGDEAACVLGVETKTERGGGDSGGPSSCRVDACTLAAAVGKMAPMCLAPVSSPAAASTACELVGELTLGAVALLQHGDLPEALQYLDSGSAAAVLQRRRLQSLALQQRLATRKRMQKAAEGPQRAVLLSQRLTALAVSSLAASCRKQHQQSLTGAATSPSSSCFVEIVDAEEASSTSCPYTAEAIAIDDESCDAGLGAPGGPKAPEEEEIDIMEALENYNTIGVMAFASVSTILHGGDELRQALLEKAAAKHPRAATGKSKGGRGGNRGKGAALDTQAKLESILSTLECHAN